MTNITKISTGFLAGNLFDDTDPIDYAESLRAHLERAYPGAEILIPWEANASGVIPAGLQTYVDTDDPTEPDYELIRDIEEEIIAHDNAYWNV